ncbi:MAG: FAD/NAD(P)-binding protein [Gammaproteobacteria bacterium]
MTQPYDYHQAEIIERIQESPDIFTLRMAFSNKNIHQQFSFQPGQFNMLYLFGVGEIPISIVSDPDHDLFDHTIRAVGRVSNAMSKLTSGDKIGVRGPYGRGWPIADYTDHNVLLVTGGLGCAPVVSIVHYVLNRRQLYRDLTILQGVKKSNDLIWRAQYQQWAELPDTQVLLAADIVNEYWPWDQGPVTRLFEKAHVSARNTVAMMCGPEKMMQVSADELASRGFPDEHIYLSMERNMQCAIGQCGHCQHGAHFICKQGPVFPYREIRDSMSIPGY